MNEDDLKAHGVGIQHHFSSGVYAKHTTIPKDTVLTQHVHPYDHLSILASGTVSVKVENEINIITGPACLTIAAHKEHSVTAITDATWFCIHAVSDDNPETVDQSILAAS
jgi:quercetin dioxygenase-like cupin family protein